MRYHLQSNRIFVFMMYALFTLIYIGFILFVLRPFWESDDIGMSMIANGHGVAHQSSPNLIFSNIILGWAAVNLKGVVFVDAYSFITYFCLWIITSFLLCEVALKSGSFFLSTVLIVGVMSKPLLEPQFTITSGLFMLCSILALSNSIRLATSKRWVFIALIFGVLSIIVRTEGAVYVLLVALPLVVFCKNISSRSVAVYLSVLFVLGIGLMELDKRQYQTKEWDQFHSINLPRAQFTDFGAAKHLVMNNDLLQHYKLTVNDIRLVTNWFLIDSNIADPVLLNQLLEESGFYGVDRKRFNNIKKAFRKLLKPYTFWLLLASFALFLVSRNLRLGLVWGLFLCSIVLGRGHVLRVYYPVLSMLLVYGWFYACGKWRNSSVYILLMCLVVLTNALNYKYWYGRYSKNVALYDELSDEIDSLIDLSLSSGEPIAAWAQALPYKIVYRINSGRENVEKIKLLGFGVSIITPLSYEYYDRSLGKGILYRYQSQNGVLLAASEKQKRFLSQYCVERLKGKPEFKSILASPKLNLSRASCRSSL